MPPLYLIDGFNFLHAVVLRGRDRARWWREENRRAVCEWVAGCPSVGARLCVVFDQRGSAAAGEAAASAAGSALAGLEPAAPTGGDPAGSLEVRYAPDADKYILARCRELGTKGEVVVVSADRSLVDRAKRHGARSLSPWDFARYGGLARPPSGDCAPGREKHMKESDDEERFVRLEVKAAYLEKLALDLNEVVIAQGQLIEALRLRFDRVERQLRAGTDEAAIPDEKPPHY